jgi:hypothetical protein
MYVVFRPAGLKTTYEETYHAAAGYNRFCVSPMLKGVEYEYAFSSATNSIKI